MMTVLYNFVRVDTPSFLSNPRNLEAIVAMCKSVMQGDPGEDPQVHACKLLEVIILQCHGKIDSVSINRGIKRVFCWKSVDANYEDNLLTVVNLA